MLYKTELTVILATVLLFRYRGESIEACIRSAAKIIKLAEQTIR